MYLREEGEAMRSIPRTKVHARVALVAAGAVLAVVGVMPMPASAGEMCNGLPATKVGTQGDDVLRGTTGNDVIVGLDGNDEIRGLSGRLDVMCGGGGRDTIIGGAGRDRAIGGGGSDTMSGGSRFRDLTATAETIRSPAE